MESKIYFNPGEVVELRQDLPNKPKMMVVRKVTSMFKKSKEDNADILIGIRCRWFTTTGELQEEVFNTKDLRKV